MKPFKPIMHVLGLVIENERTKMPPRTFPTFDVFRVLHHLRPKVVDVRDRALSLDKLDAAIQEANSATSMKSYHELLMLFGDIHTELSVVRDTLRWIAGENARLQNTIDMLLKLVVPRGTKLAVFEELLEHEDNFDDEDLAILSYLANKWFGESWLNLTWTATEKIGVGMGNINAISRISMSSATKDNRVFAKHLHANAGGTP